MPIDELHVTVDNDDYTFLTEEEISSLRILGQNMLIIDQYDHTPREIGQMLCLLTRDIEELHILISILRAKAAYPKI